MSPLTPFYVCGAALAIWAVVVALIGITRPQFPGSRGTERAVVALTALLMAAALAAGIAGAIAEEAEDHETAALPGVLSASSPAGDDPLALVEGAHARIAQKRAVHLQEADLALLVALDDQVAGVRRTGTLSTTAASRIDYGVDTSVPRAGRGPPALLESSTGLDEPHECAAARRTPTHRPSPSSGLYLARDSGSTSVRRPTERSHES